MHDAGLTFEAPVLAAERKLRRLAWRIRQGNRDAVGPYREVWVERDRLRRRYARLTPWERVQLARHPASPHGGEAAAFCFGELDPLRGDGHGADDPAVLAGVGRWRGRALMVVSVERGRDHRQRRRVNFGMPGPAGFRKAVRALDKADRWSLPVVTLVDTPGADPSAAAERGGVAEAISALLLKQAKVRTATVGVLLGEGGSGGALAFLACDRMLALAGAYFSVISPEACASILWRDGTKTAEAAEHLRLLPEDLRTFGILDTIIAEPAGGAHRYPQEALCRVREAVDEALDEVLALEPQQRRRRRNDKYRMIGS